MSITSDHDLEFFDAVESNINKEEETTKDDQNYEQSEKHLPSTSNSSNENILKIQADIAGMAFGSGASNSSADVAALASLDVSANTAEVSSNTAEVTSTNVEAADNKEILKQNSLDLLQDPDWRSKKKHIFILSEAGKPIFSLHGKEDKLATLFGIIQALVSFVQHAEDEITSIQAKGMQIVFLMKSNLILVAVSRTNMSVTQLQLQLSDAHNQILSTLTFLQLSKIFVQRKNFDLRRLLAGSERLINNLVSNDSCHQKITNSVFTFLTNSTQVLPLAPSTRTSIVGAIKESCSKIKNLVFAILIADNRLVVLVRMKSYSIHPTDLRLIFNLVECSESFKSNENWIPICLPKFDMNGYLHAHVSYLTEECAACLLLLSVDNDAFFTLAAAKQSITEKLRKSKSLEAITEAMENRNSKLSVLSIPELRHFLYKPTAAAQLLCSAILPPFTTISNFTQLEADYYELSERLHNSSRPLKLIFISKNTGLVLAWATSAYELYAVFEPLVDKSTMIENVDTLVKLIEKEYDTFFIRTHPTF